MIFSDHVNVGIRLSQEGDLNFLFFDDVSGSPRSSAAGKPACREEQESEGEKVTCGSAEHD
jgi:hypothetical protein